MEEIGSAGTPTTVRPSQTSRTTEAPAPTTTSDPTEMPWIIEDPIPMNERGPTLTEPARRAPGHM